MARAFGFIAYPDVPGSAHSYTEGYVYANGRRYPARATKVPWLQRILPDEDDVSLELQSELGTVQIAPRTALSSFRAHSMEVGGGFDLQQSGARYSWDGQHAFGMIERLATDAPMTPL